MLGPRFFFEGFCHVAKVVIQREKNLAKLGYILVIQVGEKRVNPIFFGTYWNLS
jgi:hypothetical protein